MELNRRIYILFAAYALCLINVHSLYGQSSEFANKHNEVIIRMIGHEILKAVGDTTSRVLPIKMHQNQFTLQFEIPVKITPRRITKTIDSIADLHNLSEHYIVEFKNTPSEQVVYSYEKTSP